MDVSVIVCTYNRDYAIASCLGSIANAIKNVQGIKAELVVVNNASTDNTAQTIEAWSSTCGVSVNLVEERRKGLSAARNAGMNAAKGQLLIFTDDDCIMDTNYIADALRHNRNDTSPVLRGGRVELGDETDLPLTVKTERVPRRWELSGGASRHENMANAIVGCNMAFKREMANKIGFFDTRLGAGSTIPGGEDTDFLFRAYLAGFPVEYVPDMVVYHHHGRKTTSHGFGLIRNYAIGSGALYIKYFFVHTNFCRQLYWDLKHLIKEVASGKNSYMPSINFSMKEKIFFNIKGAWIFFVAAMVKRQKA